MQRAQDARGGHKITFDEAMQHLVGMFPHIEKGVITMVLRANDGHIERTIGSLLEMETSVGEAGAAPPPAAAPAAAAASSGESSEAPPTAASAAEAPALDRKNVPQTGSARPNPNKAGVMMLPDDFLRPPSYYQKQAGGEVPQDQEEQDRMLALMAGQDASAHGPSSSSRQDRMLALMTGQDASAHGPSSSSRQDRMLALMLQQEMYQEGREARHDARLTQASRSNTSPQQRRRPQQDQKDQGPSVSDQVAENFSRLSDAAKRKFQALRARMKTGVPVAPAPATNTQYASLPGLGEEMAPVFSLDADDDELDSDALSGLEADEQQEEESVDVELADRSEEHPDAHNFKAKAKKKKPAQEAEGQEEEEEPDEHNESAPLTGAVQVHGAT
eukprot:g48619.t1